MRRALPAAGAAVRGGAAPVPALAAARLRPRRAPRRRALPVRARHVRPGHAAGRRRPVRRLRLAPAAGADRRAVRPARRGRRDGSIAGGRGRPGRSTPMPDDDPRWPDGRRPARGCSTRPACSTAADVHVAAAARRARPGSATSRCCSRWRSRCAACAAARCASTWPRTAPCWPSDERSTWPRCPGRTAAGWPPCGPARWSPAARRARCGRCDWSTGCSTSTGTGGRRSGPPIAVSGGRPTPPAVDRRGSRRRSTGCSPAPRAPTGSGWPPRSARRCAAVDASSAGGPGTGKTHHRRAAARAAARPAGPAAAGRAGRADRQGGGPAAGGGAAAAPRAAAADRHDCRP